MKIDLKVYKDAIINDLVSDGLLSAEDAAKVISKASKLIDTHLPCSHCGNILLDRCFYKSKVHKARRFRLPVCKECHPKIYGSGGKK